LVKSSPPDRGTFIHSRIENSEVPKAAIDDGRVNPFTWYGRPPPMADPFKLADPACTVDPGIVQLLYVGAFESVAEMSTVPFLVTKPGTARSTSQ
jgi:hypothetical protein